MKEEIWKRYWEKDIEDENNLEIVGENLEKYLMMLAWVTDKIDMLDVWQCSGCSPFLVCLHLVYWFCCDELLV